MATVTHVLGVQAELGEGPLWHAAEQALYFVDILQNRVHRYRPENEEQHVVFDFDLAITAIGLREGGGFVVATRDGFAFWDGERLQPIAQVEADRPASRMNDGAVDRQGRFWAGTMLEGEEVSALYRLDRDLSMKKMISGVTISNGIDWSPDNQTMYFTDTLKRTIYAYPFDPTTGALGEARMFASCREEANGGFPDGLTVDREGFVWSARWGGWKVVRYDPNGQIAEEIKLPVEYPTSCTFGGADLTTLYITSARTAILAKDRYLHPQAGDLFALHTNVSGLPAPMFKGAHS